MKQIRATSFLGLLALSGATAYYFASGDPDLTPNTRTPDSRKLPDTPSPEPTRTLRPLLLEDPRPAQIDPTNYEVTVSDSALRPIGRKIENESRTRLQELTARYQLTANQRREAFPLIVSHHPDFADGLVVNGFSATPPESRDFATRFSEILNLTQREIFQEDLGADRAWWRDVLSQIREDIDGSPPPHDPDEAVGRPDLTPLPGD